jgi:hypothetical protein
MKRREIKIDDTEFLQGVATGYNEAVISVEQLLGEQVGFTTEVHKETPSEYNEGYVDGLKQALAVLSDLT